MIPKKSKAFGRICFTDDDTCKDKKILVS